MIVLDGAILGLNCIPRGLSLTGRLNAYPLIVPVSDSPRPPAATRSRVHEPVCGP